MLRNVDTEDEENHVHTNINTKNLSVSWLELLRDPIVQSQALEGHDTLGNVPFTI